MHSYSQYLNLISCESTPPCGACFNALAFFRAAYNFIPIWSHQECHNTLQQMMMDSTLIKRAFSINCINCCSSSTSIFLKHVYFSEGVLRAVGWLRGEASGERSRCLRLRGKTLNCSFTTHSGERWHQVFSQLIIFAWQKRSRRFITDLVMWDG